MKKIIALLLACITVLSLCACTGQSSSENEGKSSSYEAPSKDDEKLTDDEIESIVVSALISEINSKYDTADASSCRYGINKTEEKNGYVYVYGEVTLYDKYGKLTTGWRDGSGTAFRTFEIKIRTSTGSLSSCEID